MINKSIKYSLKLKALGFLGKSSFFFPRSTHCFLFSSPQILISKGMCRSPDYHDGDGNVGVQGQCLGVQAHPSTCGVGRSWHVGAKTATLWETPPPPPLSVEIDVQNACVQPRRCWAGRAARRGGKAPSASHCPGRTTLTRRADLFVSDYKQMDKFGARKRTGQKN